MIRRCYESYWKQTDSATRFRPSFEELFPFSRLVDEMQDSFLPLSVIQRVTELIGKLELAVKQLYRSSICVTDEMEETVSDALMAYYWLYWNVLKDSDSILKGLNLQKDLCSQEGRGYVFLRTLLNLGCSFRKTDGEDRIVGIVTPFAPRYLSAILETSNLLTKLDNQEPADKLYAETEILNTFVSRFLRWFLVAPDGTLCHAAMRSVSSFPQEREDICILIRSVTDYSSFEGISELRLFEKIKYELKWQAKSQKMRKPLRVLIAGDIDADQIIRFGRMLEGWLANEPVLPDLHGFEIIFFLFTNNCSFDCRTANAWEEHMRAFCWLRMEHYPTNELFESPKSLERWVDRSDLLFFLDCRQMYEDFYALPCSNLSAFFQQTAEPTLEFVHKSASGHVLSPNNPFFQVQNLLLGRLYGKNGPALLKKSVSATWLNHIKTLLEPYDKIAYFYFSDLDAAQDLYWREDCFVRSENYAGKRMAILRYGGRDELELTRDVPKKIIVFNLWQFIKHCNLHRVDCLVNHFGLNDSSKPDCTEEIYLLSNILIGIDYSDWPNVLGLTFSYPTDRPCFQKKVFAERLQKYMEDMIVPCFQRKAKSIYYAYLRKCIASFLFSDAKSVDDLLFIHIFKRHFSLLRSVSLKPEENYSKLANLQPKRLSYSGKRFYQEVMGDYDEPYCYVADQQRKLTLMKESGKLPPDRVFQNIRDACRENQYFDSNLYRNCTRWLEENH